MTAQRERSEETRRRILAEATHLFADLGVADGSMRMLAERLGLSKAALYHHFPGKDALAYAIHSEVIDAASEALAEVSTADVPPPARLRLLIAMLLSKVAENREAFTVLLRDGPRLPGAQWADIRERRVLFQQGVESLIAEGMDQGYFKKEDPLLVTLAVLGMCNWSYTWIRQDGRIGVDEIADTFSRMVLAGIEAR